MDITACDLFRRCVLQQHHDDWSELIRRYGSQLRSLVWQALVRHKVPRPGQELEDYVQEFYLRLLTVDGHGFRGHYELQLWHYLARVADNLVTDRGRGRSRKRRTRSRSASQVPSPVPTPESRAIVREHLRFFLRSCRRAAAGWQVELKMRIMRLAFFDGLSSREIAWALAGRLSPAQVDSTICRLRRHLARRGIEVRGRRHAGRARRTPLSIDR